MSLTLYLLLAGTAGYIFGSIPFGLVLTRLAGYGDIRKIGSGNIGATNVLRTGNKTLALLTMLLDIFKGAIAAWLAFSFVPTSELYLGDFATTTNHLAGLIAGTSAFFGHIFPIWLGFKGGKGVATACGLLIGIYWPLAMIAFGIWVVMLLTFRYSSLSALTAAALVPFISFFMCPPIDTAFFTVIVLIVIIRHHANISRLIHGQESKVTFKKK